MVVATSMGGDTDRAFEVGLNDRLPPTQLLILGLQNIFGMTGMFVFPGIIGRSFNLPAEQIAYLYGMVFAISGLISILQSVLLLRLPIIQGPYAGNFAALLAVGHSPGGGLGVAFGSFCIASLIWCALTIPVRGLSAVAFFARYLRSPLIAGMTVMLIMMQISSVALPNWIGRAGTPSFPVINLLAGAVAVAALIIVTLWGGRLRRGAILLALALGTACYTAFAPISFAAVANAPFLVVPQWFPFGFSVRADFVIVFLLALIPAGLGSMALYQMVADWCDEPLSATRMSEGVFAIAIGSVLGSVVGAFSTMVYPDNIAMLRSTRVLSRYATLAAGVLLIVLGSCTKFDMLLVVVPLPVLSAAATLLFGIIFMHGVHLLTKVEWDDRSFISAGLAVLVGLGGLFVEPETMREMPLMAQLLLRQPVLSGGLTLVILDALLRLRGARSS